MQRDVSVSAAFDRVDLTTLVWIRINMNARSSLAEFRQVQHLMYWLVGRNHGGMSRVHVVRIRGDEFARTVRGVAILDAEILHAQPPNRSRHPAVLVAVIVNPAHLTYIPADRQHFEEFALVDQVSRVVALGVKKIWLERFGTNGIVLGELQ